eukprot:4795237-Prymnesium_polylepis.1
MPGRRGRRSSRTRGCKKRWLLPGCQGSDATRQSSGRPRLTAARRRGTDRREVMAPMDRNMSESCGILDWHFVMRAAILSAVLIRSSTKKKSGATATNASQALGSSRLRRASAASHTNGVPCPTTLA